MRESRGRTLRSGPLGRADRRSDLYSRGVLLAECAGADLPAAPANLISRLTQVDPSRRPASAAAALALLTPGSGPTAPIAVPRVDRAPTLPVRSALRAPSGPEPDPAAPPVEGGLVQQLDGLDRAIDEVGR